MSILTFDEETHTYRFGGSVVPSVTQILAPLTNYSFVPAETLRAASIFGRAVHKTCELYDLGELNEDSLDPMLAPYLKAWIQFSKDYEVEWLEIEKPLYNEGLRYAGTPDRIGRVRRVSAVVDIKTTAQLYPSVGPQLAAYAAASPSRPVMRIGVQLKADGTYHAEVFKNPTDYPVFCSLMTLKNWCNQHGIVPNFN